MPWRVASVEALPGSRLRVGFIDGAAGMVDLKDQTLKLPMPQPTSGPSPKSFSP
jgi:hypothetical protein